MHTITRWLGTALLALGLLGQGVTAEERKPIHFGELTWESGSLITEMLRLLVEQGYGYPTDTLPGSTVSLETALARNDIQVIAEEWAGRSPAWVKAEAAHKVYGLGDIVKNADEGWWVPDYVVHGDPAQGIAAQAPELRSVSDLPRYRAVFRDAESPDKGRFLNSPTGWTSEIVNSQKLKAYGLADSYVNFRSGSGAAMDAEIASAIRRGKPVLFYYWSPTPLMGRYKLVRLEEPPFDAEAWKTLSDPDNPNPRGSRSLPAKLSVGVSAPFHKQYPELVAMFEKVDIPIDLLNAALAKMSETRQPPHDAARDFLKANPQVWQGWLPAEQRARVEAAL
ncbi:ABC transporter substrate-binding protein [Pseudomonas sp. LA21]|uniref:ABC transporter substrate-binding protein n=1 Tax=unclassified Pseudomonas TaxID=196821 RepID=UPI001FB7165A|nr:ABC transporter substrate-binding protein [Pseudomonas sp. LA21]MCJ1884192.1 ABC transporter substrate-binding protein [Pseudomonas sp. LA21]